MPKQTEQLQPVDESLFLQEYLRTADQNPDQRPDIEASALEFATQIDGKEAQLIALNAIFSLLQDPATSDRGRGLITELEDDKFGFGIPEIDLDDLSTCTERLLHASNPAFVIRNGQYDDFRSEIADEITRNTGLAQIRQTLFPSTGMVAEDSKLHLDNFIGSRNPGFVYSLTAARVLQGSVLFISGFASKAAQRLSSSGYDQKQQMLNSNLAVERLFSDARITDQLAPRHLTVEELHTELYAVSLNAGDVVVWPQGGKAAEAPAWHAVRQLGRTDSPDFVPRKTVSYHFE